MLEKNLRSVRAALSTQKKLTLEEILINALLTAYRGGLSREEMEAALDRGWTRIAEEKAAKGRGPYARRS